MFIGNSAYARVLVFVVWELWEEVGVSEVSLSRQGDDIAINVSSPDSRCTSLLIVDLGLTNMSIQGKKGMVCLGWYSVVFVSSCVVLV